MPVPPCKPNKVVVVVEFEEEPGVIVDDVPPGTTPNPVPVLVGDNDAGGGVEVVVVVGVDRFEPEFENEERSKVDLLSVEGGLRIPPTPAPVAPIPPPSEFEDVEGVDRVKLSSYPPTLTPVLLSEPAREFCRERLMAPPPPPGMRPPSAPASM